MAEINRNGAAAAENAAKKEQMRKYNANRGIRLLTLVTVLVSASALHAQTYRFRSPESEERYYSGLREQQRYQVEQAQWEARARSLERSDRYYAPIRRGADAAFRAGTYALPRYGGVVRRGYNYGMSRLRGESR